MSSTIDPAKLKVVDLRSELSSRGLDTKGNKAALVKRLKDALEQELKQDLPDTSIADTSTEDLDTSQSEEKTEELLKEDDKASAEEMMEEDELIPENPKLDKTETKSPEKAESSEKSVNSQTNDEETEENGEQSEQGEEKAPKKSRWAEEEKPSEEADSQQSGESKDDQPETSMPEGESEHKGEKRRRSSPSPERSQRRRSRSPVKEDEPVLDNDKVQLSWYDSDLHLQLDKESFLSAKPLTEGAFGYAWAGVRATHGVSSGKVCYEVKITEEIKWEDFGKHEQRGGRDRYRTDHRKNQRRDKKGTEKKPAEKPKSENGETKLEKDEKSSEKDEKSSEKDEKSSEKDEKSSEKDEKSSDKDERTEKDEKSEKEEKSSEMEEKSAEEEKPTEDKENAAETKKLEETATEEVSPAEAEDKTTDENTKDESKNAEETPMETDASEENKKPVEMEGETKSKEEKTDTEEAKTEPPSEPLPTHLFRVGWSVVSTSLQLGEEKYSYGYESTGKFVTDRQFVDYGIKFGVGDVVGAFLSLDAESITIRYTVNGEVQPIATSVPRSELPEEDFVLFPHVLSRNYAFEFNLGDKEEPWFPIPSDLEDYLYLSKIENKIPGPLRPENRGECEVVLMCGLPGSGKTHWVKEYVSANVEKKYTVLGNSNLLEKMTVSGEPLKTKFKGRWSMLVDKLQKCLNKLIAVAALRRRNYIIDQTNVFPSAQRRKMRPFEGFKRRAVIVVVGDEEQARRQSLQEAQDGKDVPDSTILEMKAAMSLPEKGDWIEEVTYVGLEETEAKEVVKKYNTAGKDAGYGGDRRFGRRDDRWHNRRNDNRGKSYRDRSYHNQRYDPRAPRHGGWDNQRSGGGNWNRDRRDNRAPSSREWRGSGRDRGNRDNRQIGNYNRNRPQSGGRGQGNWSSGWGQGWNQQQSFGGGSGGYGGNQNWGGNQWKYAGGGGSSGTGGGQSYGGYGGNWNYYGQYAQNWNNQGQQTHSAAGTESTNTTANSQYSQGYNTQEAWAQYAQQYAHQQAASVQNQVAATTKK